MILGMIAKSAQATRVSFLLAILLASNNTRIVSSLSSGFQIGNHGMNNHYAGEITSSRRMLFSSCFACIPITVAMISVAEAEVLDGAPNVAATLQLNSSNDSLGLELLEVKIGTLLRPAVAIKRILPNGKASHNPDIQPGMILYDFPSRASLLSHIQSGSYPIKIRFVDLAGETMGDLGRPIVSSQDALKVAQQSAVTPSPDAASNEAMQSFSIQTIKRPPSTCKILSQRGDVLEIRYEARYQATLSRNGDAEGGIVFDSSDSRGTGQPYMFVLGNGDMIPGVDQGLYEMCPGEIRELTIPPRLGYGARGNKLFGIPNDAVLSWKVELVTVNSERE